MDRRAFVSRLLDNRGDLLVVASIGSPTYDVTACGDHPRNFYIWSGLGSTPTVGLGLALAQPNKRVVVVTGDGDVLMALGSLSTIGVMQPKNLIIVCLDNGHYSASGMQPSATRPESISRTRPRPASCALRRSPICQVPKSCESFYIPVRDRCSFTRLSMRMTSHASFPAVTASPSSNAS